MATQIVNVKPTIDHSRLPELKETYDIQWNIPDWKEIRSNAILLKNQKIIFETGGGSSIPYVYSTRWSVGFQALSKAPMSFAVDAFSNNYTHFKYALVQWKLLEIDSNLSSKLQMVTAETQLLTSNGLAKFTDEKTAKNCVAGQLMRESQYRVEVLHVAGCSSNFDYIRADGSIEYKLKLTMERCLTKEEYTRFKMTQFMEKSNKQMCNKLASLLNERDISSDLKIVTRDNSEIFVHRVILKAQCPVFAGMLNCDLSESNTGIVRVNDTSGKCMTILLNYFYTGQLVSSWSDEDIVVELTYAAGKYQITQILELLDDMLGRNIPEGKATNIDVQLVNLAAKLSMPSAEGRLLKRIVDRINKVTGSQQIFELFGYDEDEVLEMAEVLGGEKFGETKALEILDDLIGNTERNQKELEKRGLHLLALVKVKNGGLKNLETRLLKIFAKKAFKFVKAEELFSVFGQGKEK